MTAIAIIVIGVMIGFFIAACIAALLDLWEQANDDD